MFGLVSLHPRGKSAAGIVTPDEALPQATYIVRRRSHLRDPLTVGAVALLIALVVGAVLAPLLSSYDPTRIDLRQAGLPPGPAHPMGTDQVGRDVWSRALYGGRVSLAVGLAAAAIAALLGGVLGVTAAYHGGWVDAVVTRLVDAALAMPAFFLLIAAQAIMGQGVINVIVMVSLVGWMMVARVVRTLTLSFKEREFVLAARALGCSGARIVLKHLVPNLAGQVGVLFALGVADSLLLEAALSFLGIGVPPTEPSWGNMLNDAQAAILSGAWWIATFPGLLVLGTALSINLVGDRIQEMLTPRL
ncbi:MAG TPA: ABC transporter permease [Chloroflexota bacterium]|nr:ABC transporter permease [Chloroflexota bacterium]